ncbi:MAG: BA14K family protein [Nitratireductor sp.]|nr:BA14K family protein [Nitratireductor sp.]
MAKAKSIRGLTLAAALAAGAFAQAGIAEAGHRHNHYYNGYNGGAAVAGAVAGVILGTALTAPRYPVYIDPPVYEERVYIDPVPVYEDPYYDQYDDPYYGEEVEVAPVRPYARQAVRPAPRQYGTDPVVTKGIDEEVYYQPGKAPKVVTLDRKPAGARYAGNIEQGSAEWVAWCRSKYRSFDVRTGTFLGYDGIRKACVVR